MATSNIKQNSYHSMFEMVKEDITFSNTPAAGSSAVKSKSLTKSGWYPIGAFGVTASGTRESYVFAYRVQISNRTNGSCTLYIGVYNTHTSGAFNGTMTACVLWQRVA